MTFPKHIKFILKVFGTGLFLFSFFRILLVFSEFTRLNTIEEADVSVLLFQAFVMGIRFDIVISGYILSLPILILLTGSFFNDFNKKLMKAIYFYIGIIYSLAFLICAIDIPYFNQFFSRFTISALAWLHSPGFVIKMIIQEFKYWWVIFPLSFSSYLFWRTLKAYTNTFLNEKPDSLSGVKKTVIAIFSIVVVFAGIRGRLDEKSPITVGTAYFSNNAFVNEIGLNANFTFLKSYFDTFKQNNRKINFMDDETAVKLVRSELKIKDKLNSPIARMVNGNGKKKNHNIVLVIMESMSSAKMNFFNKEKKITPFLDSLVNQSYFFENIYTAGTHTHNGIFSTLFSFPSVLAKHSMRQAEIPKYNGMAETLKRSGYSTIYFTTHDDQFDNVGGFLKCNNFDKVISKSDYPSDKILSTLGVSDDYMFEFSIKYLNDLNEKENSFFAAFMTSSDHGPYIIPEYFKPKSSKVKDQIVEYADWSLSKFIKLSQREKWFSNTLFVFIADHGAAIDVKYNIPLNYFRTPLLFYAPEILTEPKTFSCLGGQIDLFPTTMGILEIPYTNNTLGIDLLNEKRKTIFFNQDEKYAALNEKYLMIAGIKEKEGLYNYKEGNTQNLLKMYPQIFDSLKTYAEAMYQTTQYLRLKKLTFVK